MVRQSASQSREAVIAVIEPVGAALVTAGADQDLDIGFHQDPQHRLGNRPQKRAAPSRHAAVPDLFGGFVKAQVKHFNYDEKTRLLNGLSAADGSAAKLSEDIPGYRRRTG
jgi:hypothetical protein